MSAEQFKDDKPDVGIIGLGKMGSAIAVRLASCGYPVAGWTRRAATAEKASAIGITVLADIPSLVARSRIVILSLFDDTAVNSVMEELKQCDLRNRLVVDTSTVGPDTIRSHALAIKQIGGAAMDAPIAGGPEMVLQGKASVYMGGDKADVAKFLPVARSFAIRVHHVGRLGGGASAKAVNNMMIISYWQCLKEALQFGNPRRQCGPAGGRSYTPRPEISTVGSRTCGSLACRSDG